MIAQRMKPTALLSLAYLLPNAACAQSEPQTFESRLHRFRVVTLTSALEHPWGLAFLPDRRMLVTERPGRLRIVEKDGTLWAPLAGVPNLALRRERAPNLRGAELVGYTQGGDAPIRVLERASLVIFLDPEPDAFIEALVPKVKGTVVWLGTTMADAWRGAELVLPVTTMAEEHGTWVNRDDRLQRRNQRGRAEPGGPSRP